MRPLLLIKAIVVLLMLVTLNACKKAEEKAPAPKVLLPIREYLIGGWITAYTANDWIPNDTIDFNEPRGVYDPDYLQFISFRSDGTCRDSAGKWGFQSGIGILTGSWKLSSDEKFIITEDSTKTYQLSLKIYSFGPSDYSHLFQGDALILEDTTTPLYPGTGCRWMIYDRHYPFN